MSPHKHKLSMLVPSIRTERLDALYDSIAISSSHSWEMIVASPYPLTPYLMTRPNVVYIETWRSPLAAQQLALMYATGEYISWSADDCTWMEGSLDKAFALVEAKDYKHIVIGKYLEGNNPVDMDKRHYYLLHYHAGCQLEGVPRNAYMLNAGIVSSQLVLELGGWDAARFDVCPYGYNDFAIRANKYGASFEIMPEIMLTCTHEPGTQGTHAPVHYAQIEHDELIFKGLYQKNTDRIVISAGNWEQTEERWGRRFGNNTSGQAAN